MPRKLKTFVTNLGFFELAVAAPSMKAALEAWGMSHNAFQHGFAKQTDDAKIVAATEARPGMVLRRPVGTHGAFSEHAELPDRLPDIKPVRAAKAKPRPEPKPKKAKPEKKTKHKADDRAAVISFEKERARRARQRAKEEAEDARDKAKRDRAVEKAQGELDAARQHHEDTMAEIEAARDKLDRRERLAKDRWEAQRDKLEAAVRRTEKS